MKRVDSISLPLGENQKSLAKRRRCRKYAHSSPRRELGLSAPLYEPLASFFMGIATPYEDEDLLVDDDIDSRIGEPWKVILYNDDIHTFDEVILQLQKALGCSSLRAEEIAFEAHARGKAIAYNGEFEECFRIMGVLREIQLIVEIEG